MFKTLPPSSDVLVDWKFAQFEPFYNDLQQRSLNGGNIQEWLRDWSLVFASADELACRLKVQISRNTADRQAENRYEAYLEDFYPLYKAAENKLKQKLLDSGLKPEGFEQALKKMRVDADLFRDENLPLQAEESKLITEYDKISGAQVVIWEGEERTIDGMRPLFQDTDRAQRERAWRIAAERQLKDREAISALWQKLLALRLQIAANASRPGYLDYRWQELHRFDYTPEDARRFHAAIEAVVVPVVNRLNEHRRKQLGVEVLRPWDLDVDPLGRPPLRPFQNVDELIAGIERMFHRVHPTLGGYFNQMKRDNLLDLDNRKNKAPGGYCEIFRALRKPFIFANSVGIHDDVQTMLHEGGHAFHVFEAQAIPYAQQLDAPMEFAEVASMGMELLSAPYLAEEEGGFYSRQEANRARIEHLEANLRFWPYMAVVDAFQLWAYENPDAAGDSEQCDACWASLWVRFMHGVNWDGLDDVMITGWQRKLHIVEDPLYYIEYGMAQLGAAQIWHNALSDQAEAVESYRKSLSLGGTVSLPELFKAAGARFAFDGDTLRGIVSLMETTITQLEGTARDDQN